MKGKKGSLYALTLVILLFAASLALPVIQGTSPIAFGLDLSGGVVVTYRPDFASRLDSYRDVDEKELLALAKETLTSRLSRNLSTLPDVVVRGDQTIAVSIPGSEDQRRILELVGKTYHLTLRLVLEPVGKDVTGEDVFEYRGRYLKLAEPEFSGDMFDERYIRVESGQSGTLDLEALAPKVAFKFSSPHDEAFGEFTGAHVGRELAILLDDRVEWVGVIESAITDSGVLAGSYDLQEATDIAMMLKSGTLPISLEVEKLTAVGPALGQEVKDLGLRALLVSLALLTVLIGLAYLHRTSLLIAGLVSIFCLLLFIAGTAALFGLTLDMVGIAGIVLSVGMGMDAFIIVFEALEAKSRRLNRRQAAAHQDGMARRTYSLAGEGRTLFHANATTLIVIALLLGTERLRSFAMFIFAGIFASVLTIFVTREVLRRTYGATPDLGFDLLAWLRRFRPGIFRFRKVYFAAVAAGLLIAGLLVSRQGSLELGADFKAGTQVTVTSQVEEDVDAAVRSFEEAFPEIPIKKQRLGTDDQGRYLLTLGTAIDTEIGGSKKDDGELNAEDLVRTLTSESVELGSLASIDNRVSGDRMAKSLSVLLLSFLLLAIYFVGIQNPIDRFFSAQVGSTSSSSAQLLIFAGVLLAVLIDVAVILTALTFLRIPISLPVVAAVLTIIGYSVNDSVVLWTHVQNQRREGGSAVELVTRGVDRILSRACLTSLSTMVPALTILLVGLGPLEDFAWVMIVGTVAGTLSSMFVVGSFAVLALEKTAGSRKKKGELAEQSVPAVSGLGDLDLPGRERSGPAPSTP